MIRYASTNPHNLGHGHLAALIGSAFVNDAGTLWTRIWVALLAVTTASAI